MTGARITELVTRLASTVDPFRVRMNAPLAPLTTFRVGGPADVLVEARTAEECVSVVVIARELGVPVTPLGGGSNVLVSDAGIRGIVLLVRDRHVSREGDSAVRAGAGLTINGLVRWTIGQGLAGLEAWAGTPGTVGGALHGNAHFKGALIGDLVREVTLLTPEGDVQVVPRRAMAFGYDTSRLQRTREIALAAVFEVRKGEPDRLREIARASLAFRKRTQPLDAPSAGCIFQNPDPCVDRIPDGIPPSAGALVDRAGLKGERMGGASVSPIHGNFIVHQGDATAADIRRLIARCKREVADRFGVVLREEIVYLGEFDGIPPEP
ncbi:MAG TPA: UDP-N-acetylmuramate dehydrogenase [Vicinamibacterales bacterium]